MINCHLGQGEDVLAHKITKVEEVPSMCEYIRLTSAKTSSLLRMMVAMISVVLEIPERTKATLLEIMNWVGISFQITDDCLNLVKSMGKGKVAEDLIEKKFTLIVHFLKNDKEFFTLWVK